MKKTISILLALLMMFSLMPFAMADDIADPDAEDTVTLTPLEVALTARPVSSEPTHITTIPVTSTCAPCSTVTALLCGITSSSLLLIPW